uniref:MLO-like protein n=1 Tax=Fagus sylvatica TaxID=28930 RepID=A0A2N9FYG8_FAGSY
MAGGEAGARELDQTPTWAVAAVCAVIVVLSIILEEVLHMVGEWFQKRKKDALFEALEKIKGELMVLGFISLLLTFGQTYIARICIPEDIADTMLPCPIRGGGDHHEPQVEPEDGEGSHHRRLLWHERRYLAAEGRGPGCKPVSLSYREDNFKYRIGQCYNDDAWKIKGGYTFRYGGGRFGKRKVLMTRNPLMVCFFRQFFRSVRRADYLTMRHGFVTVHLAPGSKFDFQKYIKKSLEDDFKVVVGISPLLWASVVFFLLVNVSGWQAMFWVSILPLIVILAVGTKLQGIISKMAIDIQERHAVVQGIPLVQVSDKHFWFSWPQLVLYLIHFVLFQYEFGLRSCFHEDFGLIIFRVVLGVGVQFMCSYITLPLYALVTQMGSIMKRSIFDEQTSKALKQWHKNAVKKANDGRALSPRRNLGGSPGDSPLHSPPRTCTHNQVCDVEVELEGSPKHTANIMASVDISGEQPSTKKDGFRDLLSEP